MRSAGSIYLDDDYDLIPDEDIEILAGKDKLKQQTQAARTHLKHPPKKSKRKHMRVQFVGVPAPVEPEFVDEQGGTVELTDMSAPVVEGNKAPIELTDFNEDRSRVLLRIPSYAVLPGEQNLPPSKFACLKTPLTHIASIITPASFALNAFVGFSGIKLENLTPEEFAKLGTGTQALCWISGASSEIINYVSNLQNIPDAFECVSHLKESFGKHKGRNILIIALASGAAVSAAAIGASAVAFAGPVASVLNMAANGFLFWVTRFYGLVNLSKRFNKYREQGSFEEFLNRLSKDEKALNQLANDYADEINQLIAEYNQNGKKVDAAIVYELLQTQLKMMKENPDFELQGKSTGEHLLEVLNWSIASLAALSVVPTFAQKFLIGMGQIEEFITGYISQPMNHIKNGNLYIKAIAGTLFGIATPLAYLNAVSQLGETLGNSWDALFDVSTAAWQKVAAPLIFVANAFAGMSGYNLTKGVIKDPDYVFKTLTPPDSKLDMANRYIALAATAAVNGKFVAGKLLPAPAPKPQQDAKADTASILKAMTKDSIKFMRKNDFSEDAVTKLNRRKQQAEAQKSLHTRNTVLVDRGYLLIADEKKPNASLRQPLIIEENYDDSDLMLSPNSEASAKILLTPDELGLNVSSDYFSSEAVSARGSNAAQLGISVAPKSTQFQAVENDDSKEIDNEINKVRESGYSRRGKK